MLSLPYFSLFMTLLHEKKTMGYSDSRKMRWPNGQYVGLRSSGLVLCSWEKLLTLTEPLSTQEYK